MEVVCGGSMFEWRNNISIAESGGRIITATPGAERGSPFVCALYVRVSILVPGATGDRGLAHGVLLSREISRGMWGGIFGQVSGHGRASKV